MKKCIANVAVRRERAWICMQKEAELIWWNLKKVNIWELKVCP